jgi:cobalamin biosynthesis protein CobW
VKVVEAQNGRVPIAVLLGLGAEAEADLGSRPSHHELEGEHDHDDFDTFIVDLPAFDSPQAVIDRLCQGDGRARHPAHEGLRRHRRQADAAAGAGRRAPGSSISTTGAGGRRGAPLAGWSVIGEKGLDKAGIEALILG